MQNKNKRNLLIGMSVCLALAASGCSGGSSETKNETSVSTTTGQSEASTAESATAKTEAEPVAEKTTESETEAVTEKATETATETETETETSEEETPGESETDAAVSKFLGYPWNNSSRNDLFPEASPDLKDDFYLASNYTLFSKMMPYAEDYGQLYPIMSVAEYYKMNYANSLITDEELINSDIEVGLLYSFCSQLVDWDKLSESGISPVKKYTDMIDGVSSIEELNTLLLSDEFPYTPLIYFYGGKTYKYDTDINILEADLVFVDDIDGSVDYREDLESISIYDMIDFNYLSNGILDARRAYQALGVEVDDTELYNLVLFEQKYGQYQIYNDLASKLPWGEADKYNCYLTMEELSEAFGNYPILGIYEKYGIDTSTMTKITGIDWVKSLGELYTDDNLASIKELIKIQILNDAKPYINPELYFLEDDDPTDVDIFVYTAINDADGFAELTAKKYVEYVYGDSMVEKLTSLTKSLIESAKEVVSNSKWLSDKSKDFFINKLENMHLNIMVPENGYLDFSELKLDGETAYDNYIIMKNYVRKARVSTIGNSATLNSAWKVFNPLLSNCFYSPEENTINVFPGWLSSTEINAETAEEAIYSLVGTVVGHEISHAFDYTGSQFNENGEIGAWLSEEDIEKYLGKTNDLVSYYDGFTTDGDKQIDGDNIKTEAFADLSGMNITLNAISKLEDFEYDLFFTSYSNLWSLILTEEAEEMLIALDIHPLSYLRVNCVFQQFDIFYETYGIKEGDGMYLAPEKRITLW